MSEPTEKQTPRTDAACLWAYYPAAMGAEKIAAYIESAPREGALVYSDFARQLETELAAVEAQAAAMREALESALRQWDIRQDIVWRRTGLPRPSNDAPDWIRDARAALSTNAGAELLAERDRLRAENESLRKSLSPTTTEKPNQQ